MSELPILDTAALVRLRSWGGEPLLDRMIVLFGEVGEERLEQMRAGLAEGDRDRVARAAHSLKSSAGNIGADRLRRLAERLEADAAGGAPDELARLADLLRESYHEAVTELARIRSEPSLEAER